MDDTLKAERDRVLARVKKMLAMADDKRGNPNEIATAAEQAARLMRKFNIEHAEVLAHEIRTGAGIMCDDIADPNYDRRIPHWYNVLATVIGRTLDCQCRLVWTRHDDKRQLAFKLFGHASDIQVAKWLFAYVLGQVQRLAEQDWKTVMRDYQAQGRTITPPLRRRWKDQYRSGVVSGVIGRIEQVYGKDEAAEPSVQEAAASRTTGALIVLREAKQQAIREAFPDHEFTYKDNLLGNVRRVDAFWKGYAESNSISVERVLEHEDRPAVPASTVS